MSIVNGIFSGANNWLNISLLILATLRIYLEVIGFEWTKLPMTSKMMDPVNAFQFHRTGLYFSIGYVLLFAPSVLLS